MYLHLRSSHSQIHTQGVLEANNLKLEEFLARAITSRKKKPPSSVGNSALTIPSARSLAIGDSDSMLSATTFDFDNIIVNSRVYRKAMHKREVAAKPKQRTRLEEASKPLPMADEHDLTDSNVKIDDQSTGGAEASDVALKSEFSPTDESIRLLLPAFSFENLGAERTKKAQVSGVKVTPIAERQEENTSKPHIEASPNLQNVIVPMVLANQDTLPANPTSSAERRSLNKRRPRPVEGQSCNKCNQTLIGRYVTVAGEFFHEDCFTCIVGIRFYQEIL